MPQIITQIDTQLHTSWQKELANVVTDPSELLRLVEIPEEKYLQDAKARKLFPVRVPRPFITRMKKGDINDPLLMQVMPNKEEFVVTDGFFSDPLEEHETVVEGLLHKYQNRVLMIVKAGCAVNCRYCFRRHFPYADNSPNKLRWQKALDYIKQNESIEEVIFSGGDPLMANDEHLKWLVGEIEAIPHVTRLRVHSRLPVVIPQRITNTLVNMLKNTRLKPVIVFHINHANELDKQFTSAIQPLIEARIPLFNQAVLLKGINSDIETLTELCETLFDNGIQPYYLHLFDRVQNAAHFDLSDKEAKDITKGLMARLSGFLMPKVVREIGGEPNKTPINLA